MRNSYYKGEFVCRNEDVDNHLTIVGYDDENSSVSCVYISVCIVTYIHIVGYFEGNGSQISLFQLFEGGIFHESSRALSNKCF